MERLKNRAARRFVRKVRSFLPCSRKMKNEITASLRRNMAEFLAEQPDAAADDLRARFGTPEVIAATCLEDVEATELLCRLRIRRRVLTILITAVILALLSWGFLLAKSYHDLQVEVLDSTIDRTVEEIIP